MIPDEPTAVDIVILSERLTTAMRQWVRWFDDRQTDDQTIIGLTAYAIEAIERLTNHLTEGDSQS